MRTHNEEECRNVKTGERLTHEDLLNRLIREIPSFDVDIDNDFVKMGDWISSQEREDYEEIDDKEIREIRKVPLRSVFYLYDNNCKFEYLKPKKLSLSLPEINDFCKRGENVFEKELFLNFKRDLVNILKKETDNRLKIRMLLDLFRRYIYKIPSASYYSEPNIDLYNHSRISAAIALSVYRYYKGKITEFESLKDIMIKIFEEKIEREKETNSNLEELKKDKNYNEKIFLVFEGDISGIQNFISTITTEGAMKILRGRSFYIYLLNKIAALKLLKELDLPETNLIFCSGGHFQIICNNSKGNLEKAKKVFEDLNKKLFSAFGTKLFFALSYIEVSPKDLAFEDKEFFDPKNKKYIFDKNRKFYDLLKDKIDEETLSQSVFSDECKICHAEISDNDEKSKCKICKKFENLRNIFKFFQDNKNFDIKTEEYKEILIFDDFDDLFFNKKIKVNHFEGIEPFEIIPTGITFKENKVKELTELTESNKIGAFKYDVDNLGKIFEIHSEDDEKNEDKYKKTLSTYSTLSSSINLFFEGLVNKLWEKKYKDKVMIVYSGGDDGFVIGDPFWVLNFAKDLYNYFKIYTGLSKKFTISGAFRIFDLKYPVKKIFDSLEEDLKEAKQSREEKNSISINGEIIRWDYFDGFGKNIFSDKYDEDFPEKTNDFEFVLNFVNYLVSLIKNEKISVSVIYRLMLLANDIINKMAKKY